MKRNILEDKIFYYENVIDNPYDFISYIESLDSSLVDGESAINPWAKWRSSNDPDHIFGEQKFIDVIKLVGNDNAQPQTESPMFEECLYIYNTINNAIVNASKDYESYHGMDIGQLAPLSISKYFPGAGMGSHVDDYNDGSNPTISVVLYLNDNYEGGNIYFRVQDVDIKPSAGSLVIFPSHEPYYHESKTLISGYKYMTPGFWNNGHG